MKKITWLFLSLMLLLGMRTAFAQDAPSAPVLISPVNNATVEPGQPISFVQNKDYEAMQTVLFYTFDDAASLDIDMDDIGEIMEDGPINGVYGTFLMAAAGSDYDPENPVIVANWMPTPTVPSNASGTITLRARVLSMTSHQFSSITTATYTVGEATPVLAPILPSSCAVPMNSTITVTKPDWPDDGFYYTVLYVLNNENFDFTQYTYFSDDYGVCECTPVPENMIYTTTPIIITEPTTVKVITVRYNGFSGKIEGWSESVTATYTIQTKPAAPTFLPDGGEVDADEEITLTTTTEGAKIYYSTTATFVNIATEEELENNGEVMMYDENAKPALSDFWDSEMAGVNPSISAASVLIAGNGGLTWSEVTTKEFIVKAKVEPKPAVAKPVITPGNDAEVHIGDTVKIICGTEGAKIYYTTDGTEATKEAAEYTVPFALTESMLVKQGNSYSLRIRAVAAKDDEVSEGVSAGYVVYPNAPVFTPAAGIVSKGTDVSITCVPSQAKIYYTTDGTMPTEEATEYTAPIKITESMTIKAVAVLGQYETHDSAAYTIGVGMQLALEPAKGYVKKGQALECTVPESVLEQYGNAFVLYVENNDVALEGDYMDLWKAATGGVGQVSGAGDVNLPFQVTSVGLDDENNEVVWTKPVVISENAPAEVKFRARMAVLDSANAEKNEDGEIVTFPLLYSNEIITTYYTEVPAPVFEPAHGLVKAGQQLGCTVPENFDWEQGNNTAFLVYVENNDTLKLEEVSAGEIVADMESAEERAYKVAVCVRDFDDDDNPVYEWMKPVVLSEDANGVIKFRARLVMMTQSQGENTAAFSNEANAVYYTKLPAARFEEADEVLQSDALNVEFPAEVDFSYYLDQAFILYVENNSEAVLEYNGTMGELQALAQGGSPALPDVPEESSLTALSAKAALPYRVAVYDAEWEEWNPSVFVTTLGEVNVRARLAVATGWDSTLTYSDEFTATYTVKKRPRPNKPTVMADNKDVTGETLKVKKGAALGFKSGYEDNDDYFVCYVIDGKDEDFANATMTGITMGTSSVKMYDPDFDNLAIDSAMNVKAATVQELASGDLWWSEITTVAFTVEFDTVETPAFSVAAGEVEKGTKVTISCATGEAKIYYTVDGSEPTAESTEYTAEISIDSAMTIKAIAVKEGMENSKVAEAAYTVKTVANESEELTGVSVYPNPNTGVFYIELPVDATIDIFATNGVLVRSINAKAGKTTLSLDHSGIYFLRIAGEGHATVKRVIVR